MNDQINVRRDPNTELAIFWIQPFHSQALNRTGQEKGVGGGGGMECSPYPKPFCFKFGQKGTQRRLNSVSKSMPICSVLTSVTHVFLRQSYPAQIKAHWNGTAKTMRELYSVKSCYWKDMPEQSKLQICQINLSPLLCPGIPAIPRTLILALCPNKANHRCSSGDTDFPLLVSNRHCMPPVVTALKIHSPTGTQIFIWSLESCWIISTYTEKRSHI